MGKMERPETSTTHCIRVAPSVHLSWSSMPITAANQSSSFEPFRIYSPSSTFVDFPRIRSYRVRANDSSVLQRESATCEAVGWISGAVLQAATAQLRRSGLCILFRDRIRHAACGAGQCWRLRRWMCCGGHHHLICSPQTRMDEYILGMSSIGRTFSGNPLRVLLPT